MIYSILLLLIFVVSGSILVVLNKTDFMYVFIALITIFGILSTKKIALVRESIVRQIIILILFSGLVLVRGDSLIDVYSYSFIFKIITAIILSMYLLSLGNELLVERLCSVFEIIALLSLITFIGSNVVPYLGSKFASYLMFNAGELYVQGNVTTFLGLGYARAADIAKYGFMRNQGFFWEPGVLGFFTTFVYLFKAYHLNNNRRAWLYCLTVLSTVSMGAITIFLFLFLYYKYILLIRKQRFTGKFVIQFSLIMLVTLIAATSYISPKTSIGALSRFFHRDLKNDSSAKTRWIDFDIGLRAAMEKPFIGCGKDFSSFYYLLILERNKSKEIYDGGISNSIISIWYMFGGIFLCYYLYLIYNFSKWLAPENSSLVFCIIILLLMHEPLAISLFTLFFITAFATDNPHKLTVSY
ncbi:MAG: O-antigen ligase family protein [Candidatus Electrothrix sp. GW3-4]|uniref:O-antigen ligase family protein n=1 Tax=Candidatus Electrothrix sp. GW3-4 TaxID=3126740 RepID=UPI0030CC9769